MIKQKKKGKAPSPAMVGAMAIILILGWFLLFSPNIIGMADSGDFVRVIDREGLYYQPSAEGDVEFFDYFHREYAQRQYFNENTDGIFTSQTLFIKLAIFLDRLFTGNDGVFDIRFYGAIHILYLAAAVYFLITYLTFAFGMSRGPAAYMIAGVVVLMFGDLSYTAYFNSFFAEGLVLISFLFSMSCALLLTKGAYSPYLMLALILLNSILLTTSKQQNAPEGILTGLMVALLPFATFWGNRQKQGDLLHRALYKPSGKSGSAEKALSKTEKNLQLLRTRGFRTLATGVGALLCLCGILVYLLIPESFVYINAYHGMTRGVLNVSENPEETLESFDIDRQYALLSGTIYFERYPPIRVDSDTLVDNFYSKYSFFSLAAHYITHPDKLLQMLDVAAKNGYDPHPEYAGNYEYSAGKPPRAQTTDFNLSSSLKNIITPRTVGFIILWAIVALGFGWRNTGQMLVIFFCILSGISQLALSVITAGDADLSKHVFAYNVAFDFINCIGAAALIRQIATQLKQWIAQRHGKKAAGRAVQEAA